MRKEFANYTIFTILILFSISLISAAGVSLPYWKENPLKISPGESTTVQLILQNKVGGEDVTFEAIISGEGVTLLDGPKYFVPLGTEVPVNLKVNIPKNANVGESYDITISFKEVPKEGEGMLRVTGAVTARFPIEIVNREESSLYKEKTEFKLGTWIFIFLGLILLMGILFIKKKKKK